MVDITVRYRDGSKDFFRNVSSHSVNSGMLIVEDTKNRFVHIILGVISSFTAEKVQNDK